MEDIAAYLSRRGRGREVKVASLWRYRSRPRERGGLPEEDKMFGRTPAWRPGTIMRWDDHERRGRGWRAGRRGQAGNNGGGPGAAGEGKSLAAGPRQRTPEGARYQSLARGRRGEGP